MPFYLLDRKSKVMKKASYLKYYLAERAKADAEFDCADFAREFRELNAGFEAEILRGIKVK